MMFRFALDEGAEFDDELRSQIARLDRWLKRNGMATLSGLPSGLIADPVAGEADQPAAKDTAEDPVALLFHVHSRLAQLIRPATPYSLRATDPQRPGWGRIRGLPFVVKLAGVVATVCMAGFFITLCLPAAERPDFSKVSPPQGGSYTTPGREKISFKAVSEGLKDKGFWNSIFGAGRILYSAQDAEAYRPSIL